MLYCYKCAKGHTCYVEDRAMAHVDGGRYDGIVCPVCEDHELAELQKYGEHLLLRDAHSVGDIVAVIVDRLEEASLDLDAEWKAALRVLEQHPEFVQRVKMLFSDGVGEFWYDLMDNAVAVATRENEVVARELATAHEEVINAQDTP